VVQKAQALLHASIPGRGTYWLARGVHEAVVARTRSTEPTRLWLVATESDGFSKSLQLPLLQQQREYAKRDCCVAGGSPCCLLAPSCSACQRAAARVLNRHGMHPQLVQYLLMCFPAI
jgi:hypothetical protein